MRLIVERSANKLDMHSFAHRNGIRTLKIYGISMYENPSGAAFIDRLMAMKTAPFAHFAALGTWSDGKVCDACGEHTYCYIPPLLVEWKRSTNVIGDFSWNGPFGELFIVKEQVAESLRTMQFECKYYSVEFVPPKRKIKTKCVP